MGVYLYASGSTSQVSTSDHSSRELLVSVQHSLWLLRLLCELLFVIKAQGGIFFSFFNNRIVFELMCVYAYVRVCVHVCIHVCVHVCVHIRGHLLHIDTLDLGFFG